MPLSLFSKSPTVVYASVIRGTVALTCTEIGRRPRRINKASMEFEKGFQPQHVEIIHIQINGAFGEKDEVKLS